MMEWAILNGLGESMNTEIFEKGFKINTCLSLFLDKIYAILEVCFGVSP